MGKGAGGSVRHRVGTAGGVGLQATSRCGEADMETSPSPGRIKEMAGLMEDRTGMLRIGPGSRPAGRPSRGHAGDLAPFASLHALALEDLAGNGARWVIAPIERNFDLPKRVCGGHPVPHRCAGSTDLVEIFQKDAGRPGARGRPDTVPMR